MSGILLCLALSGTAFAKDNSSYTQVGRNINIGPDQQVGELTCFGCSIRVRGQVSGDITTFGGSITLENQAQVAGDVTSFGGDLRLDQGVRVAGGATVFGGQIRRDPQATVAGDVTSFGGHGWALLILLTPLVGVGLFVALVIWLIQRVRRPSVPVRAGWGVHPSSANNAEPDLGSSVFALHTEAEVGRITASPGPRSQSGNLRS